MCEQYTGPGAPRGPLSLLLGPCPAREMLPRWVRCEAGGGGGVPPWGGRLRAAPHLSLEGLREAGGLHLPQLWARGAVLHCPPQVAGGMGTVTQQGTPVQKLQGAGSVCPHVQHRPGTLRSSTPATRAGREGGRYGNPRRCTRFPLFIYFYLFISAASGLSCGTRGLRCGTRGLRCGTQASL